MEMNTDQLKAEIKVLRELVDDLSVDPSFGILTAPALRRRVSDMNSFPTPAPLAAIYLDVDDMKAANSRYGHDGVDRRIHAALKARSSDCVVGRWLQGDEIVAIVPWADAIGFCDRLLAAFRGQGMSCTIAAQRVSAAMPIEQAIRQAGLLCHKTKKTQKGIAVFAWD
jgi:GGDEF domain-containing protein